MATAEEDEGSLGDEHASESEYESEYESESESSGDNPDESTR